MTAAATRYAKSLNAWVFLGKKPVNCENIANTAKRSEYLEILKGLMQDALDNDHLLVFMDEAHIHLDTDEGFGWSVKGERFWVSSCSPGLAKVSFYGVYLYNLGQVRLFPSDVANGLNTIEVLSRIMLSRTTTTTISWRNSP